ncbi:hypothetical protein DPMN_033935 [Dreissena polymorpha]|uniref:Uncharacterized protein n=1 Tax=Dreissena polymorpha TaxID=45954 RepID=A0A9D4M6N0_DREPO|nr:hypothetical protein DPMN_033935 [Dreissena polymorpha]
MLLEQEFTGRAASRCCSSIILLLEQHLNTARAAFFLLQQKLKFRPLGAPYSNTSTTPPPSVSDPFFT